MSDLPSTVGSNWWRWDVHVHAPDTINANNYPKLADGTADFDTFADSLKQLNPRVKGLGITDYYSLSGYERLRSLWKDRFPNIDCIFPNIEIRLALAAERGAVNGHLLISPEDENHVTETKDALAHLFFEYSEGSVPCTDDGLIKLGRHIGGAGLNPESARKKGIEQFKPGYDAFLKWYRNQKWLRNNSLLGFSAKVDGVGGLKDGGMSEIRTVLQRESDFFFTSNDGDRQFWLGNKVDSPGAITAKYQALKPCLHGSDAHSLKNLCEPNLQRYCWIKAEPTFEGLRQVIYEPEDRVHIGPTPPEDNHDELCISRLSVDGAEDWLEPLSTRYSKGLTAIIGPRGSGKTAALDLMAAATSSHDFCKRSFLSKAGEYLSGCTGAVVWYSGNPSSVTYSNCQGKRQRARYLSQSFVNSLCEEPECRELLKELERLVFQNTPIEGRHGTSCFKELADYRMRDTRSQRESLRASILDQSASIENENSAIDANQANKIAAAELERELKAQGESRKELLDSLADAQASQKMESLENEIRQKQEELAKLTTDQRQLQELSQELERISKSFADSSTTLKQKWQKVCGEPTPDFRIEFVNDPVPVVNERLQRLGERIRSVRGTVDTPGSFLQLTRALEKLKETLKLDQRRRAKLDQVTKSIDQLTVDLKAKRVKINDTEKHAESRINQGRAKRLEAYLSLFETLAEEQQILNELYAPLGYHLAKSVESDVTPLLSFATTVQVRLEQWLEKGNAIIDKRGGPNERTIEDAAKRLLLSGWKSLDAATIEVGLSGFLTELGDSLRDNRRKGISKRDLADWLFSVDHIALEYEVSYDSVSLQKLSPGTRGIVLLTLFLELDQNDNRPLLIDQPEDNLDPRSVYEILVPSFRRAKKRRQIILVTHNPNLVVNTDAELVVVADARPNSKHALPFLSYRAGGLENPEIRRAVCDILEGGQRAFQEREKRYRLLDPIIPAAR